MPTTPDLQPLLHRLSGGDRVAFDAVFTTLYADLTTLAASMLGSARRAAASPPKADTGTLVHETYLRMLARLGTGPIRSATHFLRLAKHAMRQHLVEEQTRPARAA